MPIAAILQQCPTTTQNLQGELVGRFRSRQFYVQNVQHSYPLEKVTLRLPLSGEVQNEKVRI